MRDDEDAAFRGAEARDAFGDESRWEEMLTGLPFDRLIEPEEIARAVLFLVADDAGFITGSTMSVNGGQYLA